MRADRLSGRTQFEAVLHRHDRVLRGHYFVVRALPGARAFARLGIIASRKAIHRAVDRNTCKRIVKEAFREHAEALGKLDTVVICRTPPHGKGRALARRELNCAFRRLAEREANDKKRTED